MEVLNGGTNGGGPVMCSPTPHRSHSSASPSPEPVAEPIVAKESKAAKPRSAPIPASTAAPVAASPRAKKPVPAAVSNGYLSSKHSSSSPESGRSSSSSLNNAAVTTSSAANAAPHTNGGTPAKKEPGRKVSIADHISLTSPRAREARDQQRLAASTNNIREASLASGSATGGGLSATPSRTSLLHIPAEKRARKVRFFINNDKFYKGVVLAVSAEKFRNLGKLLEHLTRIMCNQVTLPNGVRYIYGLDGKLVESVAELSHEGNYVCSSNTSFRKLDYPKLSQEQDQIQWNRMKRETYLMGLNSKMASGLIKRDAYKQSGHSKSFGVSKTAASEDAAASESRFQIKPKIIAVLRSGMRPRKAVRVLLNHRNTKSFDNVLGDLTNLVKLDTGAVRKVFTLDGKPVLAVADFAEAEVFVAYGSEKNQSEDFDLDVIEFRNVQAILKSPELDAKYEKFSTAASPKTRRRKFLNSRVPTNKSTRRHARKSSASRARESPRPVGGGSDTGNGDAVVHHTPKRHGYPADITSRYVVGDIIGDGNFAVVRRCFNKKNKREYALKVIDKAKCQGKEHMIESEIRILTQVSHPHIIELFEVYDFPDEKYLVTEYVRGGDLFDAIAADTKYTEDVSRGMVRDLTLALKYLHDQMVVHRDIKPENLLVVDLARNSGEHVGNKSLKLGDFGLAQVVSEPLFTVCGTPTYVAPEILAETGYGVKVDVWATGVIMYILLVGFPPFSSRTNNQEELFDQILSGLFEFNSPDWDDVSYPAKELISWMLQVDPLQRYSAYEVLQHPWIKCSLSRA